MNEKRRTKISKFLSLILRHQPEKINLVLDGNGWADVCELLEKSAKAGNVFTREELVEVVATNDKKRFSFDETKTKIRASQGHSIAVEIGFEERIPPSVLYHGTAERNLDSILEKGLEKRARHHVHLSSEMKTARSVGSRYGKPMILQIDAARMAAEGHKFYISANEVWLVDKVAPEFLKVV
jgi:putative RNA 2'-phosphotransferase